MIGCRKANIRKPLKPSEEKMRKFQQFINAALKKH